jgi:hypothetical protein
MKKQIAIVILVFISLLLATSLAAAQQFTPGFTVTFAPVNPYPDQRVLVTVQAQDYEQNKENLGQVDYLLKNPVTSDDDIIISGSLVFDENGLASFDFLAPSAQDTYDLLLTLTYAEDAVFQQKFALVVETALPDSVATVFAGLGLFVSVMIIMAVGTEVVIEFLKTIMGFKTKPTAMQALEQLRTEIPGAIAGLGIDPSRQKDLEKLLKGVTQAVKSFENPEEMSSAILAGDFRQAYESLETLKGANVSNFEKLRAEALRYLQQAFDLLYQRLPASEAWVRPHQKVLMDKISSLKKDEALKDLDAFGEFKKIQSAITKHTSQITAEWVMEQTNTYLESGRKIVNDRLEEDVIKTLKGLGISDKSLDVLRQALNEHLDQVEDLAHDKVASYALTVRNLLGALEARRNEIQSPGRKIWRSLRESQQPIGWLLLWFLLFGILIAWPVLRVMQVFGMIPALLIVLAVALALGLLAVGLTYLVAHKIEQNKADLELIAKDAPQYVRAEKIERTLGFFLRFVLERVFNAILGRESDIRAAIRYGQIDPEILSVQLIQRQCAQIEFALAAVEKSQVIGLQKLLKRLHKGLHKLAAV